MRLLIVDDEEIIRKGLQMIDWASVGITQVLAAEDGTQAQGLLRENEIDLVVSDIRMPGLDGLELARYISTHMQYTRIILLTGFSDFNYAQQAIHYGVTDYLLKPVRPKELLQATQRTCQSLQLKVEADRIIRDFHDGGDAFATQQQVFQGFQKLSGNVTSILFYLAEHYWENVTLTALSEEFHFSTIHVSRMIKKETGYSFLDILTCIRLSNAVKLLWETDLKVNQICEKVGLTDQRYFSKVFKKVFACSPMEYRKRNDSPKNPNFLELLQEIPQNK